MLFPLLTDKIKKAHWKLHIEDGRVAPGSLNDYIEQQTILPPSPPWVNM